MEQKIDFYPSFYEMLAGVEQHIKDGYTVEKDASTHSFMVGFTVVYTKEQKQQRKKAGE